MKKSLPDYFRETEDDNFITWMFDEAKKEFPKQVYQDKYGMKHMRTSFETMEEMTNWFEKWFGNE